MNVFLKCVGLVLCSTCVSSFNEGDPCLANGDVGVCKIVDDCDYAVKLMLVDEKRPPMCGWRGMTRIVCCPLRDHHSFEDRWYVDDTRGYFEGMKKGILRSQDMTCRYDGNLPILCCENVPEAPPPAEPATCPPLQLPAGDRTDVAFRKCLEYQRYVNTCVSSDANPDVYEREETCGIKTYGDRIVGDPPAERAEFPHMALLGYRNTVNTGLKPVVWVAGGSLISDRFILTAGHVLSHRDYGSPRYALLGATNKSEARDGLLFNIIRHIPHNLYVKKEKRNDIALLELDRRVKFSEFIRPACLPSPAIPITADRILAVWSKNEERESESEILFKVLVAEHDYESGCKQQFSNASDYLFDKDTMLCAAGGRGDIRDPCQGDSGGPLMAYARDVPCSYVVRGVVSFGPRCGAGVPGVYTNVAPYVRWVQDTVWPK